jgi:hypothetical protein
VSEPIFYQITMKEAAAQLKVLYGAAMEKPKKSQDEPRGRLDKQPTHAGATHFINLNTKESVKAIFRYNGGRQAFKPSNTLDEAPAVSQSVLVIPAGKEQKFDLGDSLPNTGTLRIRLRPPCPQRSKQLNGCLTYVGTEGGLETDRFADSTGSIAEV